MSQFNFDIDVKAAITPPEPHQLVEKAMTYDSGKSFTKSNWNFACIMWPNLGWNIKQAEQTLEQLLQEGKIRQIERDRYELRKSFQ